MKEGPGRDKGHALIRVVEEQRRRRHLPGRTRVVSLVGIERAHQESLVVHACAAVIRELRTRVARAQLQA